MNLVVAGLALGDQVAAKWLLIGDAEQGHSLSSCPPRRFPPPWSVEELDAMLADGAPARNNSLTEAGRLP